MALPPGTRLAAYEIVSPLGAGGMGEVYRARDARLHRDVAIKVLPDLFRTDRRRLERFDREAQALAALNHSNIAHIYGVIDDPPALVMECVDGEDLAERLRRGPIPLDEALALATQVAEGMEAAHERGILHRDLKPANIKVTGDGVVKILDFGLAKALDASAFGAMQGLSPDEVANSPTISAAGTELGIVLGTAAYISPEQARGRPADRRSDVWAFGVVLYEMLTGRRPFEGAEVSDVIASVLKDTPRFEALPPATPSAIKRLLRRCLERDRAKRLDSMSAVRLEIEEALGGWDDGHVLPPARRRPVALALPWAAAIASGAALVWVVIAHPSSARSSSPSLRLRPDVGFDGSVELPLHGTPGIALSPDGTQIVFVGRSQGDRSTHLFLRRLDKLSAAPIDGTENGVMPFFSPDGHWIAFSQNGKLNRIPVTGGAPVLIAYAPDSRGGYWCDDDTILFTPFSGHGEHVLRVPSAGGEPKEIGPMVAGHVTQRWPQMLPGGRAVIYTGSQTVDTFEEACLVVQTLDGGPPQSLACGGYGWRYAPTGHVLYLHQGGLFALPFDATRPNSKIRVSAVPILQDVAGADQSGAAHFSLSANGTLAYLPSAGPPPGSGIELLDRSGKTTPLPMRPLNWRTLQYSPDGKSIAMAVETEKASIWVYDVERSSLNRLMFNQSQTVPSWTPDGTAFVYASPQDGPITNLWWERADGSGEPHRITTSGLTQTLPSVSPKADSIVFTQAQTSPAGTYDIMLQSMQGDPRSADWKPVGLPRKFLATQANEGLACFSPDGKWIAYASNESGQFEVYVRPLSGTGKWTISTRGGSWPAWSLKTPELFFGTLDGAIYMVRYDTSSGQFHATRPERWSQGTFVPHSPYSGFSVKPNGALIAKAVPVSAPAPGSSKFVFITNFFEELRAKAAGSK
jgi:serine/threonine-protein kinase